MNLWMRNKSSSTQQRRQVQAFSSDNLLVRSARNFIWLLHEKSRIIKGAGSPSVMGSEGEIPTGIPPKILLSGRYYFFCWGGNSRNRFRGWFNGFGSRSGDQQSEDSAIRFSPASLTNSKKFVCATEGIIAAWSSCLSAGRHRRVPLHIFLKYKKFEDLV